MASAPPPPFGSLLKQYRVATGLTQEALAARAGLAVRSISDMERGLRRTPYRDSLNKLAEALQLSADERTQFEAAARWHSAPITRRSDDPPVSTSLTSAARQPGDLLPPVTTPSSVETGGDLSAETGGGGRSASALPSTVQLGAMSRHARFTFARGAAGHLVSAMASMRAHGTVVTRLMSVLLVGLLVGLLVDGALLVTDARGPHPSTGGMLCLATEFPTAGDGGSWGVSLEHAVQLAVQQNHALGNGYTLEALHYSETSYETTLQDPLQIARNVTAMVQTPCILGMVGPVSSSVAAVEMPITAHAGLAMISPANTVPGLTMRLYAADDGLDFDQLHPAGKQPNYFRTVVNDAFQGRELADLASRQPPHGLGARSAFVVDDHTPYGDELTGGFTQEFLAQSGMIVGTDGPPFGGTARIAELATRILTARPDVVCYGGTVDGGGGLLKEQLARAGYTGLFVGGDGIAQDPAFIDQAGAAAAHDVYAIVPVPDLARVPSDAAARFVNAFHAQYHDEDVDGYGASAYDAAMVLITAMKGLIRAGKDVTRQTVLDQVQDMQYAGVTGQIRFDNNGDIAHGVFDLYTIQADMWVWVKQETV